MKTTQCFAVLGNMSIIDTIDPATGRSTIFGESLDQIKERYPEAVVTTIDEFCAAKAALQDVPVIWTETTEERYDEMLGCLPPATMTKLGFLVGEPSDHHAGTGRPRFAAFIHRTTRGDGWSETRYYESSRPMTVVEFSELK